ncbi:MAG TPA: GNAT family N-acetyltransferase [Polyangiaceae bacterium]|nr:GNAT family N-acetyltransferase [Polyangiaceae bacterium]
MSTAVRISSLTNVAQITEIARLAREIWDEYYVPIIGRPQVEYMLAKFQTTEAIRAQIDSGFEYFLLQDRQPIGYASIRHDAPEARIFISKLYVLAAHRNSGVGRQCLQHFEHIAHERGATVLWLTVNKGNPSLRAYERLGFRIAEAIVTDIGGGFVMDDYRMEKALG